MQAKINNTTYARVPLKPASPTATVYVLTWRSRLWKLGRGPRASGKAWGTKRQGLDCTGALLLPPAASHHAFDKPSSYNPEVHPLMIGRRAHHLVFQISCFSRTYQVSDLRSPTACLKPLIRQHSYQLCFSKHAWQCCIRVSNAVLQMGCVTLCMS